MVADKLGPLEKEVTLLAGINAPREKPGFIQLAGRFAQLFGSIQESDWPVTSAMQKEVKENSALLAKAKEQLRLLKAKLSSN